MLHLIKARICISEKKLNGEFFRQVKNLEEREGNKKRDNYSITKSAHIFCQTVLLY